MQDDLEFPSFPWGSSPVGTGRLCFILGLPLAENFPDLLSYCPCLVPTTVGERGVVGSWRLQMPLLIRDVEAVSVSAQEEKRR